MDRTTALRVFDALEEATYEVEGMTTEFPTFNVRLDALTGQDDERCFRLFTRIDPTAPEASAEDNLRFILDLAKEYELTPTLDNAGVELT